VGKKPGLDPELRADDASVDDLTADIPDSAMPTWESQAAQYPRSGPPGISYFRGEVSDSYHVDCLLYRTENGELVGILNHYPADFPPYESEGNMNIWVHPAHRRKGIGTDLFEQAFMRWEPQLHTSISESGLKWLKGMDRKIGGTDRDFRSLGWQAFHKSHLQETATDDQSRDGGNSP